MNCDAAERVFQAFLDGELAPDEVEILQDHLGECDKCRRTLAELKESNRLLLKAFHGKTDSNAFARRVIERIGEKRKAAGTPKRTSRKRRNRTSSWAGPSPGTRLYKR